MAEWIFLRHGQSVANAAGWLSGWDDVALTAEGEAQAQAVRALLADSGVTRVLVSDLGRARRTAELAMPHPVTHVLPELRERNMGALQGQRTAEVKADGRMARWLEPFAQGPPAGESHQDVLRRSLAALAHWDDDQPTLIVAHGTLVKDLVAWIDGVEPDALGRLPAVPNASPLRRHVRWRSLRRV